VSLDLSENILSLDLLLLFHQGKSRRKIKIAPAHKSCIHHCAVNKCICPDLGLLRSAMYAFNIKIRWLKPTAMDMIKINGNGNAKANGNG